MDIPKYICLKKELYKTLWTFLKNEDENGKAKEENFQNLINLIESQRIRENANEFKIFLRLLLKISKYHHGPKNIFQNIERILLFLKDDIKKYFYNKEIFIFFQNSFSITHFLIRNKIIEIDQSISQYIINDYKSFIGYYFYPEIKSFIDDKHQKEIEKHISDDLNDFDEKRQIGENSSHLCSLIREDSLNEFIIYINQNNIPLKGHIKYSLFETNSYLTKKTPTLIEYSAFFGSINIFNYLHVNGVQYTSKTVLYAIHGRNYEIIHSILNDFDDKSRLEYLEESIKCHHNEIANFIIENLLSNDNSQTNEMVYDTLIRSSLHYCNFEFCPENISFEYKNYATLGEFNYLELFKLFTKEFECNDETSNKNLITQCAKRNSYEIVNLLLTKIGRKITKRILSESNKLTRVEIPSNITSLGEMSFFACKSLIYITIPSSVTEIISESFRFCSSLKEIVIPSSVDSFGLDIFDHCSELEQVVFEPGSPLNTFHGKIFGDCKSLKRVVLPSSMKYLDDALFNGCISLKQIEIPSSNTEISLNYQNLPDELIIPSSVSGIESFVFYGCTSLKKVKLSSNMSYIGCSAFGGCTSLTSIEIPQSIKNIGAFSGCTSLASIEIPPTVEQIGGGVFSECTSLKEITLPPLIKKVECFRDCTSLRHVTVPSSVSVIGYSAFEGCTSLEEVEMPQSVTIIEGNAFAKCTSLKKIIVPSSVTKIGGKAFVGCTSMESIDISSCSITVIEQETFVKCTSLKEIVLPSTLQVIEFWSFTDCSALEKVVFPNSLIDIKGGSFGGCSSLIEVIIPSSVNHIGSMCFASCTSLIKVTINSDKISFGQNVFMKCTSLHQIMAKRNVVIPNNSLECNPRVVPFD
ncbi:hypothetical protein M9Y10_043050 [Tritrichomonas musculus]|uniref:Uncharacterized protein n=1 Tax=Tritrichomonas musculus TaxID=1915356 RepID=A0ABR2JZ94_9EUKA